MGLNILQFNKTHFMPELEARGHRVVVAGVPEEQSKNRPDAWSQTRVDLLYQTGESLDSILSRLPENFSPDRIIYHDDSAGAFRVTDIKASIAPSILYSVDAHVHGNWHPQMAGQFDLALVAQKNYVERFAQYTEAKWFPLWAPQTIHPKTERPIPVCFRGNLHPMQRADRVRFLEHFSDKAPLDYAQGAYADAFCSAKIILNEAINDDVNFRIFESLICGGLLLTPHTENGLLDLFENQKHLVTYKKGDADDAADKAKYYLENQAERETIAEAGRSEVLRAHSSEVRGAQIVEAVEQLTVSRRPFGSYGAAFQYLFLKRHVLRDHELAESLTDRAADELCAAARCETPCDQMFTLMACHCYREYSLRKRSEKILNLLTTLVRAFPDQFALLLLLINSLNESGRTSEAVALALEINSDTTLVLTEAKSVAQQIMAMDPVP